MVKVHKTVVSQSSTMFFHSIVTVHQFIALTTTLAFSPSVSETLNAISPAVNVIAEELSEISITFKAICSAVNVIAEELSEISVTFKAICSALTTILAVFQFISETTLFHHKKLVPQFIISSLIQGILFISSSFGSTFK